MKTLKVGVINKKRRLWTWRLVCCVT